VFLDSRHGSRSWVNSEALPPAGITATPQILPAGDHAWSDGEPTGWLKEDAAFD